MTVERLLDDAEPLLERFGPFQSDATGAGKNEDSAADVGGSDVGRWYATPSRMIPEVGQGSENSSECSQNRLVLSVTQTPSAAFHVATRLGGEETVDILKEHPGGVKLFDGPCDLIPQPCSRTHRKPCTFTCDTNILAGKTRREQVNLLYFSIADLGDIAKIRHPWEPVLKDQVSARIDLRDPPQISV